MTRIGIAPSILSADLLNLEHELDSVEGADYIHFDVMDGTFVPQISYGHPMLKAVKAATNVPVDVHLMIQNPDEALASYIEAGADIVTFHMEAATHAHRMVSQIHAAKRLAGVAINPGTSIYALDAIIADVDLILVMSVDPGFGGQRFIPETIQKLKDLRALCDHHRRHPIIEVDGGINEETAASVVSAGANLLVAGSGIFKHTDRVSAMETLRTRAQIGLSKEI